MPAVSMPTLDCLRFVKNESALLSLGIKSVSSSQSEEYETTFATGNRCCWAQTMRCYLMNLTMPPSLMGSASVEQRGCATNTWTSAIWRSGSRNLRCVCARRDAVSKETLEADLCTHWFHISQFRESFTCFCVSLLHGKLKSYKRCWAMRTSRSARVLFHTAVDAHHASSLDSGWSSSVITHAADCHRWGLLYGRRRSSPPRDLWPGRPVRSHGVHRWMSRHWLPRAPGQVSKS